MARVAAIIGRTGSGKSSSIRSLNAQETFVIKCLPKPLPFKDSGKMYNKDNQNTATASSHEQVISIAQKINNIDRIKNLIIDDAGHIMISEFFKRARETGYTKYTEIGQHMQSLIESVINLREDLNIAFIFHEDMKNGDILEKKIKTVGQLLDNYYDPLETVTVALFTNVEFGKDKGFGAEYSFLTNKCIVGGVEIPAKSPMGMFEDLKIPNDLNFVFKKMEEFYG